MHCNYMTSVFFQIKQQKKEIEKLNLTIKEQEKEIWNLKVSLTVTYLSFIVKLIYMCYVHVPLSLILLGRYGDRLAARHEFEYRCMALF